MYSSQKFGKIFITVMIVLLIVIIAFGVLSVCGVFDVPEWKYTVSYPMTNIHINANGM